MISYDSDGTDNFESSRTMTKSRWKTAKFDITSKVFTAWYNTIHKLTNEERHECDMFLDLCLFSEWRIRWYDFKSRFLNQGESSVNRDTFGIR